MKKIITLLLLIGGFACAASAAKTIYVENSIGWQTFCLYAWKDGGSNNGGFPGVAQSNFEMIEGKQVYTIVLEDAYEKFILSNNNDKTVDLLISDVVDGAYYYIDPSNGYKACTIHQMTIHTYKLNITTSEDWSGDLYVYLWGNDGTHNILHTGDFPGTLATDLGNHQYTFTFKTFKAESEGLSKGLIFSKGSGQSQTSDYSITPGVHHFYLTNDMTTEETVTTNGSGYCTYVNSNPLTISGGATAYYATDKGNGSAEARSMTNPAANTPMLIKGDPSTTYSFAIAASGTDYSASNAFKAGTGATLESGNGPYNYILNGDAFYAANGKRVAEGKAYLQLSAAASARALVFADDEATGINVVETSTGNASACYNLSGQRVANPQKGLYIVNGRKVVLK